MPLLPSHFPVTDVAAHFEPETLDDLIEALGSVEWRIGSGRLYKIMIKADPDDDDPDVDHSAVTVLPFLPNSAQQDLLTSLHNRTVILKARQLGFTTAISLSWLDHALFNANQRVGIIAQSIDDAAAIFRDKVRFAYDNLPVFLRQRFPLARDSAKELLFAHNNSSIRVSTSMRSATIHRLHVSEMGKIAAKFPEKAVEIVTGALPAVPVSGIAVMESTAEGQSGEFYEIAIRAQKLSQLGRPLSPAEWLFKFYPWFTDPNYRMNPEFVRITEADHSYFARVEAIMNVSIDTWQRAFYCAKRDNDFSGNVEKMWREMPSTPDECWQKSIEGTYYAPQLAAARIAGRIGVVPHVQSVPVNTFWDIGSGDGTGIWLHQWIGATNHFIGYIEGWGQGYAHYVKLLRETGFVFGGMFLPHDAVQERQLESKVGAPLGMLQELAPDWNFIIVPRVSYLQHGIDMTRTAFNTYWFDEKNCKAGLDHLALYKKKWNTRLGMFVEEPEKQDGHSEAADALRQHGQGFDPALIKIATRPDRTRLNRLGAKIL